MPDVFISHSSYDNPFAFALAEKLREFGQSVFLDAASIKSGADWTNAIQQNLNSSPVFLLLASKNAMASDFVQQEAGWAMSRNCTIIPIVWDMKAHELPGWLAKYQAVDLTNRTAEEISSRLAALMRQLAEQKRQRDVNAVGLIAMGLLALIVIFKN